MADLHALSSGLKAVVTFQSSQGIEQARMSCGGHGYSNASHIPTIFSCAVGACTYEGENMVMLLQLARAHARMFIATSFFNRIGQVKEAEIREVLEDLLLLHLDYELVDQAHYLLQV
ncbi:Peroxisomal acyl-coenzyme A oxidase 1 [Parelaphostrongylus tenuis]|uniref:Peroxisomal acyl-coenzyme A oxidase 1 n=1 Tax=Parelaphostrongylus tenuis TaxID=148309 RepID=A0AAD5MBM1_PARTN|nr:Peroxisomal acyl-coenzyme A oxidase 1 [Parelaphostrongylus tenuis]